MNEQPLRNCVCAGEGGYGLLEMLMATAISGILLGVLLQFAVSAHTSAGVQGETADLQQRLRVAVEAIRHDIILAGAGPTRGQPRGPLSRIFPPIVPARIGSTAADPELSFHSDRVGIIYVPDNAAQTRVVSDMPSPGSPIVIDGAAAGCRPSSACGFTPGADVLIYEPTGAGGAHEVFSAGAVDTAANMLTPAAPLSRPYSSGARVAGVVRRTYYLDAAGKRLMVYDGARSDVPLVDHVVDLRFTYYGDPRPDSVDPPPDGASNCAYAAGSPPVPVLTNLGGAAPKLMTASLLTDGPACGPSPHRFDADLLRIRRVSVAIRLEAESPEFRGRGGPFTTAGISRASARRVADLQTIVDIAPRNMASPIILP